MENVDKHIGIFLFQKNEFDLFPLFVEYYGSLFGYQNIFVFDNDSDTEMKPLLLQAESLGVNVKYGIIGSEGFERKGEIIGDEMNRYMDKFEVVVPIDCDEFLALKTAPNKYTCDRKVLLDYLYSLEPGVHRISDSHRLKNHYSSHTIFYRTNNGSGKLLFKKHLVSKLHLGYHDCEEYTKSGHRLPLGKEKLPDSKLCYFELHNKPYELYYKHAYAKMNHRVDLKSEKSLLSHTGLGLHIIRFLGKNGKSTYYNTFRGKDYIYSDILQKKFSSLETKVPSYFSIMNGKDNVPAKEVI